jgi:hypothetical protein
MLDVLERHRKLGPRRVFIDLYVWLTLNFRDLSCYSSLNKVSVLGCRACLRRHPKVVILAVFHLLCRISDFTDLYRSQIVDNKSAYPKRERRTPP